MSVTDDQQFCLRWNNFQTYITSQFETLRDDEDFVDVTLACDGQRLGAHKVVLSACSPFFKELFKTNPCRHPIVFMRDVEVRHIVALLEFMYAGEVNVAQTHLAGFLRTAESLQIRGLTDAANTKKDNENQIEAQPTSTQLPISPTPPTKPLKSKTPSTTSILKSRISPSRTVTSSQEKSPDSPEPPRKKPKDDETVDPNPIDTTTLALRTDLDNSSPELTKSELTQINPFAVETTKLLHSEIDITTDLIEPKLELLDYSEDDLTNPDDKNFLDADQHNSFANLSGENVGCQRAEEPQRMRNHLMLKKLGKSRLVRKYCRGCYRNKQIGLIPKSQVKKVITYCFNCDKQPHFCLRCFDSEHFRV